jgi:uncharacterized protein YxjI
MHFSQYTISIRGLFIHRYEVHQGEKLLYTLARPSFFKFRLMDLKDEFGETVVRIRQQLKLAKYRFDILEDNQVRGTVSKGLFSRKLEVVSSYGNFEIKVEKFHSVYTIIREGEEVAKVSRKRFRRKNCYGIAIKEGQNDLFLISVVLVISWINKLRKKKS